MLVQIVLLFLTALNCAAGYGGGHHHKPHEIVHQAPHWPSESWSEKPQLHTGYGVSGVSQFDHSSPVFPWNFHQDDSRTFHHNPQQYVHQPQQYGNRQHDHYDNHQHQQNQYKHQPYENQPEKNENQPQPYVNHPQENENNFRQYVNNPQEYPNNQHQQYNYHQQHSYQNQHQQFGNQHRQYVNHPQEYVNHHNQQHENHQHQPYQNEHQQYENQHRQYIIHPQEYVNHQQHENNQYRQYQNKHPQYENQSQKNENQPKQHYVNQDRQNVNQSQQNENQPQQYVNQDRQNVNESQQNENQPQQYVNQDRQNVNESQQNENQPQQYVNQDRQNVNQSQQNETQPQQNVNQPQGNKNGPQQNENQPQPNAIQSQQYVNQDQQNENQTQQSLLLKSLPLTSPTLPPTSLTSPPISPTSLPTSSMSPPASSTLSPPLLSPPAYLLEEENSADNRISERICYLTYFPPKSFNVIAGGDFAEPREFVYMAAIGYNKPTGGYDYLCGGTLISRNFILTAAHCRSANGQKAAVARIGGARLDDNSPENLPQEITDTIIHPDYNRRQVYNDIALLKLKEPSKVTPACLWTQNDINYNTATAIGYGQTAFGLSTTTDLLKVDLQLYSNQVCQGFYTPRFRIERGLIDSQVCAGDFNKVKDTCPGDSGGPLLARTSVFGTVIPLILGVTSFGSGCAEGTPGAYTKVSSYLDWIEPIVWPGA